jgi:uncharacterized membrane protein YcaP (DUF421 family)
MTWKFLVLEAPLWQLILRGVAVYVFLLLALRLAGRRETAQMTNFDLILLLVLSNAVQNSINAGDNSLTGGLVSALTLLLLNWLVGYAVYRWPAFERLIQGRAITIVSDGQIYPVPLARQRITLEQLRSALRKQGISGVSQCREVILEPDGTLTAIRSDTKTHSLDELISDEDAAPPLSRQGRIQQLRQGRAARRKARADAQKHATFTPEP